MKQANNWRHGIVAAFTMVFIFAAGEIAAAITFVASTQDNSSGIAFKGFASSASTGTTLTVAIPAGAVVGDYMLAQAAMIGSSDTLPTPTGWTKIGADTDIGSGANRVKQAIYRKAVTSADITAGSVTWTFSVNRNTVGGISAFSGVDLTSPVDNSSSNASSADATTITATGFNTSVAGAKLVLFYASRGSLSYTQPTSFEERYDLINTGGSDISVSSSDFEQVGGAGATGNQTATMSASSARRSAFMIALKPAPDNISINIPSGTIAGDVMIASIAFRPSSISVTPPSGWTLIRLVTQGSGNTERLATYYRVAGLSEPSGYTWTFSGTYLGADGGILAFRGVDNTLPIDAEGGLATTASLTHTAPSISPTSIDAMLVTSHAISSSVTWNPAPTGMTETVDISSQTPPTSNGVSLEMNRELRAVSGATGTRTATATSNSDVGSAQSVALRPASVIDHFDINIGAAAGSTCSAKSITITAQNSSNATATTYTGTINITTSASHGSWGIASANGTLTDTVADDGAASYAFVSADNGVISLNLTNHHADDLTITVVDSGLPSTSSTSSTINFRTNAFVITNDAVQVAGRNQAMSVALWRQDLSTGNCSIATTYTGAKNLDAWLTLDTDNPGGTVPTIGALSLPTSAPASNPASNNLALTFTNGSATFNLSSTDVGKYMLNIRDDTLTFATAINISGASESITTRPFALHVDVTGNPGASASTGTVFTSAGTNFTGTVRGVRWAAGDDSNNDGMPDSGADLSDNAVTASYAWATTLSPIAPFTPATGSLGTLNNGSVAQGSFSSGSATINNLSYTEVGSFTMRAAATNYLNSAGVDIATDNGVVGRFTPAYFDVTRTHGCAAGSFTYSGQPFAVTVTARDAAGNVTQNYDSADGFAKDVTLSDADGDADPLGGFNGTNVVAAGSAFTNGVGSSNTVAYTFTSKQTAPVILNLRGSGNEQAIPSIVVTSIGHTEETTQIRAGRVQSYSVSGSELVDLAMPLRVQYYVDSDTGFFVNAADVCTAVTLGFTNYQGLVAGDTCVQDTGAPGLSGLGCAVAGPVAEQFRESTSAGFVGNFNLYLRAPGAGQGSVDVTVDLSASPWLRYDWDGDGADDDDPVARATFGIYRGSERLIHLRERR